MENLKSLICYLLAVLLGASMTLAPLSAHAATADEEVKAYEAWNEWLKSNPGGTIEDFQQADPSSGALVAEVNQRESSARYKVYVDDDENYRLYHYYNPSEMRNAYLNNGRNYSYSQGRFLYDDHYVNSFSSKYYVDFSDPSKAAKAMEWKNHKLNSGWNEAAFLLESAGIVTSFIPGGFGTAICAGFELAAAWAKSQDSMLAEAYGADYALTDWLIEMFDNQSGWTIKYYPENEFYPQPDYDMKVLNAQENDIQHFERDHRGVAWEKKSEALAYFAEDKEGVRDGYAPDLKAISDYIYFKVETKKPWAGKAAGGEEEIIPTSNIEEIILANERIVKEANGGREVTAMQTIRGKLMEDSQLGSGDKAADHFGSRYTGFSVNERKLTEAELAYLQQVIYYLCGCNDWRMMLAEASNLKIGDLTAEDFRNSVQAFAGYDLSPFWNIKLGSGFLPYGHRLMGGPGASGYNYIKSLMGSDAIVVHYEPMSKSEKQAYMAASIEALKDDPESLEALCEYVLNSPNGLDWLKNLGISKGTTTLSDMTVGELADWIKSIPSSSLAESFIIDTYVDIGEKATKVLIAKKGWDATAAAVAGKMRKLATTVENPTISSAANHLSSADAVKGAVKPVTTTIQVLDLLYYQTAGREKMLQEQQMNNIAWNAYASTSGADRPDYRFNHGEIDKKSLNSDQNSGYAGYERQEAQNAANVSLPDRDQMTNDGSVHAGTVSPSGI